jgi:hypothetical protein
MSIIVTLAACEKEGASGPTGQATTFQQTDPGLEPRSPLRYRFRKGRKQTLVTEVQKTAAGAPDETQPPAARAELFVHQKDITPTGELRYHFELSASEASDEGMKTALAALKGLRGRAVVTGRGHHRRTWVEGATGAPAKPDPLAEALRLQLLHFPVPFPEDAVGVGAMWVAETGVETDAFSFRQKATYKLVLREGDTCRFEVTIQRTVPGLGAVEAVGQQWLDLTGPIPESDLEVTVGGKDAPALSLDLKTRLKE